MKVLAICGSPRRHGNTEVLLDIALEALSAAGVAGEKVLLAGKTVGGCLACLKCREARDGRCHGREDDLTPLFPDIYKAEGLILGSPVYFGAATPEMAAFITRVGYVSRQNDGLLRRKVGAPVVVGRRAGHNFTLAQLNYFFLINGMVVASARYWPVAFGGAPGEVANDAEGVDTVRDLGANIAWLVRRLYDAGGK